MLAAALLSLALLGSAHACSTGPLSMAGIVCRITKPALLVCKYSAHLSIRALSIQRGLFSRAPPAQKLVLGQGHHILAQMRITLAMREAEPDSPAYSLNSPSKSSSLVRRPLLGCRPPSVVTCVCLGSRVDLEFRREPRVRNQHKPRIGRLCSVTWAIS